MDRTDEVLLLLGQAHGKLDNIQGSIADHHKRIKSLETTRTRQSAIFGFLGAGLGWLMSFFRG